MESKYTFLEKLPIFADLDPDELEEVADLVEERVYPPDSVVVYQRDVAGAAFIVRSGRLLSIELGGDGTTRQWRRYMAGDVIGDTWLFTATTHPGTIKAVNESHVLLLRREPFLELIAANPSLIDRLDLTDAALDAAEHSTFALPQRRYGSVSLMPDEIVKFEARRSIYFFLLRALGPGVGILVLPLLTYFGLSRAGYWSALGLWAYLLLLLPVLILGLWILYLALDWSNDWFVVTNRHLIHYELDLRTFSSSVSKIPVDQIQSVEVEKSNLWANLFNVGVARITTAAQSTALIFDFIDNPDAVRDAIVVMQRQVQALDAGREQAAMRTAVERHFSVTNPYQPVSAAAEEEALADEEYEYVEVGPTPLERIGLAWARFTSAFRTRVEADGSIVYRKHVFVLLNVIKVPAGIVLALLLITWATIAWQLPVQVTLFMLLPLAVAFGGLVWQFEDWRNDTYQLTDRYVVDIDRRPFGFGESRKQAELGNVQNVNADRPNFLATIFNYGFVQIETAGATADITFEFVAKPNQVQSDIFRRREQFRQRMRRRQREEQRGEYAVLLDVYHQANEQGRIPRRTPTGDLEVYRAPAGVGEPNPRDPDRDRFED